MALKVCVKRVTVDYVAGGKPFRIEFTNPMDIGSLVFNRDDLDRAQAKQNELAAVAGSSVPSVTKRRFKEFGPFPDTGGSGSITELEPNEAMDLSEEGPSLWWHRTSCLWFHPEQEE
jgi:hypothetical protein